MYKHIYRMPSDLRKYVLVSADCHVPMRPDLITLLIFWICDCDVILCSLLYFSLLYFSYSGGLLLLVGCQTGRASFWPLKYTATAICRRLFLETGLSRSNSRKNGHINKKSVFDVFSVFCLLAVSYILNSDRLKWKVWVLFSFLAL